MISEKAKKIIEAIKKKTAMQAYKIELIKDEKPTIFDSKFGGVPYWDMTKDYPFDEKNKKMMLLAQINFTKEALESDCLPKEGMLQFFINAEDGDLILFAADRNKVVYDVLGNLRLEIARRMNMLDKTNITSYG